MIASQHDNDIPEKPGPNHSRYTDPAKFKVKCFTAPLIERHILLLDITY